MISIEDNKLCCGCSACAQACPLRCIKMIEDIEGFFYPSVVVDKCINCGKCEKVCPFKNDIKNTNYCPDILGAKAIDDNIRFKSSSGGIFTLFAQAIINSGGIVYGAEMSDDCYYVRHTSINNIDEIYKLQGSKYVQSRIEGSYRSIKDLLNMNKYVLFSGTPCQVAGLKKYLIKDYDNLFTVDVVCHGVPSEKLWRSYITHIEKIYKKKVTNVEFRSKKYSWKNFGNQINVEGKKIFKFSFEDSFFRMFNSSISMRPSCYNCKTKGSKTASDITIGDFWKIEDVNPDFDDNRGVSIVLLNTEKGKSLFNKIKDRIYILKDKVSFDTAISCNPPIEHSIKYSPLREQFYIDVDRLSFKDLEKKYTPMGPRRKWKVIKTKIFGKIGGAYGVLITLCDS